MEELVCCREVRLHFLSGAFDLANPLAEFLLVDLVVRLHLLLLALASRDGRSQGWRLLYFLLQGLELLAELIGVDSALFAGFLVAAVAFRFHHRLELAVFHLVSVQGLEQVPKRQLLVPSNRICVQDVSFFQLCQLHLLLPLFLLLGSACLSLLLGHFRLRPLRL